MSLDELKKWLESEGFITSHNPTRSLHNSCSWYAYRRSKLEARECETNEGKGCQIVVYPYSMHFNGHSHESAEIEVCGEAGGTWWKLQAYSIHPDELRDKLPEIEASLISAWNSLKVAA